MYNVGDLEWKEHPSDYTGELALIKFDNGYSASVLRGGRFYTTDGTYEIAVLNKDNKLDYTTPITNDVLGYLTEEEANNTLKDISELPEER